MSYYIPFNLDALSCAPDVARSAGVTEDSVIAGLARTWAWSFKHKKDLIDKTQVKGFFGSNPDALVGPLASFGFIEPTPDGVYRVKGAERWLRIRKAQSEAAAKTNAGRAVSARSTERSGERPKIDEAACGEPAVSDRSTERSTDRSTDRSPLATPTAVAPNSDALTPSTKHQAPNSISPARAREELIAREGSMSRQREDLGSGAGTEGKEKAVPAAEDPMTVLKRVYGQEFEQRCRRRPTAPDSVYDKVGAWLRKSGFGEDELRYCVGCLIDEPADLSLLPHKADGYLARRSHDDFEGARMLTPDDLPGAGPDEIPPPGWKPPLGLGVGADGRLYVLKPGDPLPPGCFWGPDGKPHRPNDPPPRPTPLAPEIQKEKHETVRDPARIALLKSQLDELKRKESAPADAAPNPEAKS